MSYSTPTKHDGRAVLFAVAELVVVVRTAVHRHTDTIRNHNDRQWYKPRRVALYCVTALSMSLVRSWWLSAAGLTEHQRNVILCKTSVAITTVEHNVWITNLSVSCRTHQQAVTGSSRTAMQFVLCGLMAIKRSITDRQLDNITER